MPKSINISHADSGALVKVFYDIEQNEDIQVIHCSINLDRGIPYWLHPRKFDLRSQLVDGAYIPLFSDENIKNARSIQFIDSAHAEIMKAEKCTMAR